MKHAPFTPFLTVEAQDAQQLYEMEAKAYQVLADNGRGTKTRRAFDEATRFANQRCLFDWYEHTYIKGVRK